MYFADPLGLQIVFLFSSLYKYVLLASDAKIIYGYYRCCTLLI